MLTGNLTFDKIILQNSEIKASIDTLTKKIDNLEKLIINEKQKTSEEKSNTFVNVCFKYLLFI
jgi:hypothetical protein